MTCNNRKILKARPFYYRFYLFLRNAFQNKEAVFKAEFGDGNNLLANDGIELVKHKNRHVYHVDCLKKRLNLFGIYCDISKNTLGTAVIVDDQVICRSLLA